MPLNTRNLIFTLLMTSGVLLGGTYSGGDGSSGTPWQIADLDDLSELCQTSGDWGAYFIQTANIDASQTQYWDDANDDATGGNYDDTNDATSAGDNEGFYPIGNSTTSFTGSYDGDGYTISNLTINRSSTNGIGLFGTVQTSGEIKDLILLDANVTGGGLVGGLIGVTQTASGTISGCTIKDITLTARELAGGLIGGGGTGYTITDCHIVPDDGSSQTNVISTSGTPGFGNGAAAGGLIGKISVEAGDYAISDCSVQGLQLTPSNPGTENSGGFIGIIFDTGSLSSCFVKNSVLDVDNETTSVAGGFVGLHGGGTIENCYVEDFELKIDSDASTYVGGFIGRISGSATVNNSYTVVVVTNVGSATDHGFGGSAEGTTNNNFWQTTSSNMSTGAGAEGKTQAEMKTLATFTDENTTGLTTAWDFETDPNDDAASNNYWDMDLSGTTNSGYPFLAWENSGDVSLPVELSSFTVNMLADGSSHLTWTTESEVENLGFIIEKKHGAGWTEIATYLTDVALTGQGSTTQRTRYNYTHKSGGSSYRLADVSYSGKKTYHYPDRVDEKASLPLTNSLVNVYPNPFNPTITIEYVLQTENPVELIIFDLSGREVARLVEGTPSAGSHTVSWSGLDQGGRPVHTGIYLCQLKTSESIETVKLTYLK